MNLTNICGINFAPFVSRGRLSATSAHESLILMKERTHANTVILTPNGVQDTAHSENICYTSEATSTDEELKAFIDFAQRSGLQVILKPTVNCKDHTWRAHISFFHKDVPCEPKWSNWFESYSAFQSHYAAISQQMGCVMHIAGCEMVMSDYREAEWRQVIADIRKVYHGPVSYNADKYQEDNVQWWDCVDYISSSGYYPVNDWDNQLDRIEAVVQKFQKPFFFAETGTMSRTGSGLIPNDWNHKGATDLQDQADWYQAMFQACKKRNWLKGYGLWSWSDQLYPLTEAAVSDNYEIYGKPAEQIIYHNFSTPAE